MIFQDYLAGSSLNDQKCSKFSSEDLKLSLEVNNFNINQFSDFLEGLFSKTAHCVWAGQPHQFFSLLSKSRFHLVASIPKFFGT